MNSRKVAIVTAASKGIGYAIAKNLSASWDVVLFARSPEIPEIAKHLGGTGLQGSLLQPDDIQRLVDTTQHVYGRIDALVCNTGHPPKGGLLSITDSEWQEGLNLVLFSVIRLARAVIPAMARQGEGSILNISSYTAREAQLDRPVSSVTRAGLASLTTLLAQHSAPFGIRVNSVLPGYVDSHPVELATIAKIPLGREGHVNELANYVEFLLSDRAPYITGQNLLFDGGLAKIM
jgi:NAD(P)-dependent dehydrogenase (short-subunit alcohol dehydrogenase family)